MRKGPVNVFPNFVGFFTALFLQRMEIDMI
jgi:hypothetical protein